MFLLLNLNQQEKQEGKLGLVIRKYQLFVMENKNRQEAIYGDLHRMYLAAHLQVITKKNLYCYQDIEQV